MQYRGEQHDLSTRIIVERAVSLLCWNSGIAAWLLQVKKSSYSSETVQLLPHSTSAIIAYSVTRCENFDYYRTWSFYLYHSLLIPTGQYFSILHSTYCTVTLSKRRVMPKYASAQNSRTLAWLSNTCMGLTTFTEVISLFLQQNCSIF